MNSNNPTSNPFKRKTVTKGFNNYKAFDEFIQNSLDKYQFVDPHQEMYDATGVYSKFIVSNKSAIPDLVIWNKKFNKNECFVEADTQEYNAFPRLKFILKAKALANASEGAKSSKLVVVRKSSTELEKIEDTSERRDSEVKCYRKGSAQIEEEDMKNIEEEDPLWGGVDVTELKNVKVKFQALPGKEGAREIDESEEDEKIESMMNRNNNFPEKDEKVQEKKIVEIIHNEGKTGASVSNFTEKVIDKNSLFDFTLVFTRDSNKDPPASKITSAGEGESQACNENKQDAALKISQNDMVILGNANHQINQETQENARTNKPQISDKELIKLNKPNMMPTHQPLGGQIPMMGMPPFFIPPQNLPNPEMYMRGNINMNNMSMMGIPMQFAPSNMMPQMPIRSNNICNMNNNMNYMIFPDQREEPEEEEEEEDSDKFLGNMNLNYNNINPSMFLEDPGLIIQKNLVQRGWFLMSKENKIIGNFNSLDLLSFLEDRLREGAKMDTFSITDYETDIYFTPANLHEILRETVPRLMEKILGKKKKKEMNKNSSSIAMVPPQMMPSPNLNLNLNPASFNCLQGMIPPSQIPKLTPMRNVGNRNPQNYNINVQYVKNDININSFGYPPSEVPEMNENVTQRTQVKKTKAKSGKANKQK